MDSKGDQEKRFIKGISETHGLNQGRPEVEFFRIGDNESKGK